MAERDTELINTGHGCVVVTSKEAAEGWRGQLTVHILGAENLIVADITSSDPYCIVTVYHSPDGHHGDSKTYIARYRTKVIKSNLNPQWHEKFQVPMDLLHGTLYFKFTLLDKDKFSSSDFLGEAWLAVHKQDVAVLDNRLQVLALKPRPGVKEKVKGTVSVSIQFDIDCAGQITSNQHCVYRHAVTGFARTFNNCETPRAYATYRVQMFYIPTIFGDKKQHWNTKYEAAIKIYSSNSIKNVITLQHKNLYSTPTERGILRTGDDFLKLISYGVLGGRPRFFTYVLVDKEFRFSETGAAFFSDFTSKHAMHAKCKEQVRYAGEFHIRPLDSGKYRFVIDNNSGTFSPDKSVLPLLKKAFEVNFPGLDVETLDFKDPKLKQYKEDLENSGGKKASATADKDAS